MVFLSSCTACESCEWVLDAYNILGASKNDATWKIKNKKIGIRMQNWRKFECPRKISEQSGELTNTTYRHVY